ncbi:hypothetical protein Tco_0013299 [Tanacetum coccineum]
MSTEAKHCCIHLEELTLLAYDYHVSCMYQYHSFAWELSNSTSELMPNDPVLQFTVQNLDQVNAMYTAFTHVRKDVSHRSLPTSENPYGEPWNFDSEEAHPSKAVGKTFVENDEVEPIPATPLDANNTKEKVTQNIEFYHQPFVFKELNMGTKDLVLFPFTNRIRE